MKELVSGFFEGFSARCEELEEARTLFGSNQWGEIHGMPWPLGLIESSADRNSSGAWKHLLYKPFWNITYLGKFDHELTTSEPWKS